MADPAARAGQDKGLALFGHAGNLAQPCASDQRTGCRQVRLSCSKRAARAIAYMRQAMMPATIMVINATAP